MPDWGKQGFLTQAQTEIMAKYLQIEPPQPPEMSLEQMKATWKVLVRAICPAYKTRNEAGLGELLRGHAARCRAGGGDRWRYV